MKRVLLISLITVATAMSARQLQIVDVDNLPIADVCVTNEKGALVGKTDNDGLLKDTKDLDKLYFSHMAFQNKCVKLDTLSTDRIVLEDANYNLSEIEVKPKELLYVQTYYRITYIDEEGPIYYRAGIIDNTYEFAKQKVSTKEKSISAAESGFAKFIMNAQAGEVINDRCTLHKQSYYQLVNSNDGKWAKLSVTTDSSGRQVISDFESVLGYIDEDKESGTRTVSFCGWLFNRHLAIANEKNEKKKEKKQAELEKEERETERNFYEVYRMDEDGNSSIGDFMMRQTVVSGAHKGTNTKYIQIVEAFATETAYIDKNEFKQTRKDNDVDKTYDDMLRYEKNHNIPPLAPNLKEQIDLLFAKDLAK